MNLQLGEDFETGPGRKQVVTLFKRVSLSGGGEKGSHCSATDPCNTCGTLLYTRPQRSMGLCLCVCETGSFITGSWKLHHCNCTVGHVAKTGLTTFHKGVLQALPKIF